MTGPETIDQALARGATIITGNARAARRLQLDQGRGQRALGRTAWLTPPILDWHAWLGNLWQEWSFHHPEAPILLTSLQESSLWKTALGDDAHSVVSPDSLAALAQQAYALLCAYQAHPSRRQTWSEPDSERFRQWANSLDRICTSNHWLSSSRIEEHLTTVARNQELTLPVEILLTGFDRFTPAQQSILTALKDCGVSIETLNPGPPHAQIHSLVSVSERSEVEACARWLRRQLEANPEARLAVLCTNVEQRRGEIDRVFRRILTPEIDLSPDAPSPRAVYEFTLGNPIAKVPVVRAAILTLRWFTEPLPQSDVTLLLPSGYLAASEEERLACARADAALRDSAILSPLISIERALAISRNSLPQTLRQRMQTAFDFTSQNHFSTETRLPGAWAELSRIALEKTGWPGFRTADSIQFQAQHRWDKLLEDLALLDLTSQPIVFSDFLAKLSLHAQQTLFAPESLDAPIQIMGPMESAGQSFDAAWFLGATDEQWPSTGRANPLLPIHIQREAGMPHADTSSDLQLAQSVTHRIRATTTQLTFSRARQNKDGELRPSPIVTALAPEEFALDTVANPPDPDSFLEAWQESTLIPFPGGIAPGGSSLLRDQAACPFRAFANYRLRAGEISEPAWGLTSIERGILLHDVLRRFWSDPQPRRIATRDDLLRTITEDALQPTLEHHIDASFAANLPKEINDRWLMAYLDAEKRRLASLLTAWLTEESKRQPFTVETCEQRLPNVTIVPLQLNLQADRIDLLPDGSRIVIDYKTGLVTASAWQGDRPDEPQLPLYAVYGNLENVGGLLFAQIRPNKTTFIGRIRDARTQLFSDLKDSSPLVKNPYQDAMHDEWQTALVALAAEFAQGEARVAPKHGQQTCQYCPLPGLCRIHEINERAERSLWETEENNGEEPENEDA